MTSHPDLVFMAARAMARFDGHDPDLGIIEKTPPLQVNGKSCAAGPLRPLWMLYALHATAVIDELRRIGALNKE